MKVPLRSGEEMGTSHSAAPRVPRQQSKPRLLLHIGTTVAADKCSKGVGGEGNKITRWSDDAYLSAAITFSYTTTVEMILQLGVVLRLSL